MSLFYCNPLSWPTQPLIPPRQNTDHKHIIQNAHISTRWTWNGHSPEETVAPDQNTLSIFLPGLSEASWHLATVDQTIPQLNSRSSRGGVAGRRPGAEKDSLRGSSFCPWSVSRVWQMSGLWINILPISLCLLEATGQAKYIAGKVNPFCTFNV